MQRRPSCATSCSISRTRMKPVQTDESHPERRRVNRDLAPAGPDESRRESRDEGGSASSTKTAKTNSRGLGADSSGPLGGLFGRDPVGRGATVHHGRGGAGSSDENGRRCGHERSEKPPQNRIFDFHRPWGKLEPGGGSRSHEYSTFLTYGNRFSAR